MKQEDYDKIPEELKREAVEACLKFHNANTRQDLEKQFAPAVHAAGRLIRESISPKKIDMSVFVGSGLDVEFWNGKNLLKVIGKLNGIAPGETEYKYINKGEEGFYANCRPRLNHIYAFPNGFDKCPIPEGYRVKVYYRRGGWDTTSEYNTSQEVWNHVGSDEDIIAFEILGLAGGWEW